MTKGAQYTLFVAVHVNEVRKWAQSNKVSTLFILQLC